MKKRVKSESSLKNTLLKAIPLSIAITALAAGVAFADVQKVQVDTKTEYGVVEFDPELMQMNPDYAEAVKAALKAAFESSNSIVVKDSNNDNRFDFGKEAIGTTTYDDLVKDTTEDKKINSNHEAIIDEDGKVDYKFLNY